MESSKKTWRNDQEKRNMIIKIGGGGIGAVILLGGALATAALASAFVVRVKARSSTKDPRRNSPPEKIKLSEEDEAKKVQEIVFSDDRSSNVFEHPISNGEKKEVESDNGTEGFLVCTQSSTLAEDGRIEINGGTPGDVEASDEILCPKNLEKDDGFVIVDADFPLLEGKSLLESQNEMPEDGLIKEGDYSKENTNLEKVYNEEEVEREKNDGDGEIEVVSCKEGVEVTEIQPIEEENDVEGVQIDGTEGEERESMELNMEKNDLEVFFSVNEEISEEVKCVEAIERAKVVLSVDGLNQEAINNVDSKEEEEQEAAALLPEFERQNEDGDERESAFPTETLEIVEKDEANEESREQEMVGGDERESAFPTETLEIVEKDEANEESREQEMLGGDERESALPTETVEIVEKDEANEESHEDENVERESATPAETVEIVEKDVANEESHEDENVDVGERESALPSETVEIIGKDEASEDESVDGDERESGLHSETAEIVQQDEAIEEGRVDEAKYVKEKSVEEEEKCDEGITKKAANEAEKKLIYHDNIEAAKYAIINEETDASTEESEHKSTDEDEEEEEDGVITSESSDEIVEESSVETSDSSTVSNSEAVWPAESPKAKLFCYEVEGKILEDSQTNYHKSEKLFTLERTFTNKYMAKRRMVVGMLSLLSSLSCSWYFNLSFVKLCIVLFLTLVVSEIHGY